MTVYSFTVDGSESRSIFIVYGSERRSVLIQWTDLKAGHFLYSERI